MRHHIKENEKKGLWAAIVILTVILVALVAFFLYWIVSPYFISNAKVQDRREIDEAITENDTGYLTDICDEIIRLTNEEREKKGLKPLGKDKRLTTVAQYKALEMAKLKYFSHDSPQYGKIGNQFKAFGGLCLGIDALSIGENLALFEGYPPESITAEKIVMAWMNSEEHRENIFNKYFDAIGVSVFYADGKKCYAAQEFMKKT